MKRKRQVMKSKSTIFLFGASEKGVFRTPIHLYTIEELFNRLGSMPTHTEGIYYAIQALLFEKNLIFYRIEEEGSNLEDYRQGIRLLKQQPFQTTLSAICMPGMSDEEIVHEILPICYMYQSLLVVSEKDLYDYLTSR